MFGEEPTEGRYGCKHRLPDGSFCDGKEAHYQGVRDYCWNHRPRKPGARSDEKSARLAKRLAEEAWGEACSARSVARKAYETVEDELVQAVLDCEEKLPKHIRDLCARHAAACAEWDKADEVLDARTEELRAAEKTLEAARAR